MRTSISALSIGLTLSLIMNSESIVLTSVKGDFFFSIQHVMQQEALASGLIFWTHSLSGARSKTIHLIPCRALLGFNPEPPRNPALSNPASEVRGDLFNVPHAEFPEAMKIEIAPELSAFKEEIKKRVRHSALAGSVFIGMAQQTDVFADPSQTVKILLSEGSVRRQMETGETPGDALEELDVIIERMLKIPRWPTLPVQKDSLLGESLKALRASYAEGDYVGVLQAMAKLTDKSDLFIESANQRRSFLEQMWDEKAEKWTPQRWTSYYMGPLIEALCLADFIHRGWYVDASTPDLGIAEVVARDAVMHLKSLDPTYYRIEIRDPIGTSLENRIAGASENMIVLNPENRDRLLKPSNTDHVNFAILLEEETHLKDRRIHSMIAKTKIPQIQMLPTLALNFFNLVMNPTPLRERIVNALFKMPDLTPAELEDVLYEAHAEFEKLLNAYSPSALTFIIDRLFAHMGHEQKHYPISARIILTQMAVQVAKSFQERGYVMAEPEKFLFDTDPQLIWNAIRARSFIPAPHGIYAAA